MDRALGPNGGGNDLLQFTDTMGELCTGSIRERENSCRFTALAEANLDKIQDKNWQWWRKSSDHSVHHRWRKQFDPVTGQWLW